jgi:hypothetical protein
VRGPDFEIPPDLPGPPPDPPDAGVPRRVVPWRAVAVVALAGTSAAGAFAWYSHTDTTPRQPAAVATSTAPQAAARTRLAPNPSTSTVTPTTRADSRTCIDSQEHAAAAPGAPPGVSFVFGSRVGGEALVRISDAASEARQALGESGAFTIHVICDVDEYATSTNTSIDEAQLAIDRGKVAHVRGRAMWIYGPNFQKESPTDQRRIVYHEHFHLVQGFLSEGRSSRGAVPPLWLIEGSARYFENAVRPADLRSARRDQIRRWAYLPTLDRLEDAGGSKVTGGSGDAYTVGFVAGDYLVNTYGRERLQHDFWVALATTDWRSAFLQVFGLTVDAFYEEFEAYRATLKP